MKLCLFIKSLFNVGAGASALLFCPALAQADVTPQQWAADPATPVAAAEVTITDFQWVARPLIVFADSPFDPSFQRQMALLEQEVAALIARDILWVVDTNPNAASDLRTSLRPRGFSLVLIGKDGTVKLRKALPWDVREISRVIDKMPMRQQEIKARRSQ